MTTTDLVHVPGLGHSQGARDDETTDDGEPRDDGPHGKDWRLLRRTMIADMLLRRIPERAMAAQLGCSKSTVHRECEKIRREWRDRHAEKFDAHVAESLAVLDRTRATALAIMQRDDVVIPARLDALGKVLASEDRRARLLGLDKPQRIEATIHLDLEAERARGLAMVDEVKRRREAKAG